MYLLPHSRLELPVFDRGTEVALSWDDVHDAANSGEAEFVRAVSIVAPRNVTTLTECLKIGDQELRYLAALCGGIVVEHSWGYAHKKRSMFARSSADEERFCEGVDVPRGLILAAKVTTINRTLPTPPDSVVMLEKGTAQYNSEIRAAQLSDIWGREQFVYGSAALNPVAPQNVLTDIDLIMINRSAT